jgi:hypothetical protein
MNETLQSRMSAAALRFLEGLEVGQRDIAHKPFSAVEDRETWFYTPTEHGGLVLHDMTPQQQENAHRLAVTGLSRGGYVTAATLMGLENILGALEDHIDLFPNLPRGRDPMAYFVTIFGDPAGSDPWAWRFAGHHMSLHYTVAKEGVRPLPTFFGADPAESQAVGPQILRPLAAEEDLGRELLHALTTEQQARAVISPVAPRDIVTSNRPKITEGNDPLPTNNLFRNIARPDRFEFWKNLDTNLIASLGFTEEHRGRIAYGRPKGIAHGDMTAAQREIFGTLLHQYFDRMPAEIADAEFTRVQALPATELTFAWAGAFERHQPHYYRIQGPGLLVEYDNTQRNVNHIHTVWRDPERDFGRDILVEHYAHEHAHTH